jgi:hypothetical protein
LSYEGYDDVTGIDGIVFLEDFTTWWVRRGQRLYRHVIHVAPTLIQRRSNFIVVELIEDGMCLSYLTILLYTIGCFN